MLPPPFQDISPALVALYGFGLLLSMAAGIWFLVVGFKEHVLWGLAMLCGCGFGQLAFLIVHFKKAWMPMLLSLTGTVFMVVPTGIAVTKLQAAQAQMEAQAAEQEAQRAAKEAADRAANPPVADPVETPAPDVAPDPVEPPAPPTPGPKPRPPIVSVGGKTVILTGAKREAYAKLAGSKEWTAIHWANPDVTDADLEVLHGMTALRLLDLANTQVTDEGLHALEDAVKLEVLNLAGTAVTEEGFREHVLPIKTLILLDIRRTEIPKKAGREWKAAAKGRTLLQ